MSFAPRRVFPSTVTILLPSTTLVRTHIHVPLTLIFRAGLSVGWDVLVRFDSGAWM